MFTVGEYQIQFCANLLKRSTEEFSEIAITITITEHTSIMEILHRIFSPEKTFGQYNVVCYPQIVTKHCANFVKINFRLQAEGQFDKVETFSAYGNLLRSAESRYFQFRLGLSSFAGKIPKHL